MHKKILLLLLMVLLVFSMTACKKDESAATTVLNSELIKLLPTEGFQWAYIGPAEYYHEMVLDTITSDASQATYEVSGEVEDVSDGESTRDYSIKLYYQVNSDSIVQVKTEEVMLDSEYDQMTLIKTPLEVGTNWTEEVKDKNGRKQIIEGIINEVIDSDEGTIYDVIYVNQKTEYSERRKIMEGYGVIAFSKSVEINDEKFKYGYGLYGKNSGYIASNKLEDDESTDVTDDSTEVSDETDASEESSDNESTTENDDSTTSETDVDEPKDGVNEEILVKNTIQMFNDAWIDFVNDDNQEFFNYVTTNGVAYQNAKNFERVGLKEEFIDMNVKQVIVNGNTATAKVYEEIKKTKDGEVTIAKYNWLYDLVKRNGKWLVNGYKKQ